MSINLEKLRNLALSGAPYDPACGLTEAAYQALARATSTRDGQAFIGGEVHGLVQRKDGLYVLGIGEVADLPGGPTDPDLTPGPVDPDARA